MRTIYGFGAGLLNGDEDNRNGDRENESDNKCDEHAEIPPLYGVFHIVPYAEGLRYGNYRKLHVDNRVYFVLLS